MSKLLDSLQKTPAQTIAYKNSKDELRAELSNLAKKTVNNQMENSRLFSGLSVFKTVPLAWMKQNMFRKGWNDVVGDSLSAPKANTSNLVTKMTLKVGAGLAALGMAAGAMIGFAIVGGTVAIAPAVAGGIVAALAGGSGAMMVINNRGELRDSFDKGQIKAAKSPSVKSLEKEKGALERAAKIEAEIAKQQEEEISKLNKEAEKKMKKNSSDKKSSFADAVTQARRTERVEESMAVNAA